MSRPDPSPDGKITPGDTYWVSLQQDWATGVVKEVTDKTVVVDYQGRLRSYGHPVHLRTYDRRHFEAAFEYAPVGHWSREYELTE